jgi:hypothetical protein
VWEAGEDGRLRHNWVERNAFRGIWRHLTQRWQGECVCKGVRGSVDACPFTCTDTICRNMGTPVLAAEDPRLVSMPPVANLERAAV